MNILFLNLPYSGHVIPTIGLVRELVRRGHQVTYLLPNDWEQKVAESGAVFLGYENSPKLDKQIRNAFHRAEEVIDSYDLVLYEQFFFPGKHLAEKHRKPCARIFTAPATNHAIMQDFLSHGGPMGIFRFPLIGRLWTTDAVKDLEISLKCPNWLDEIAENPPACNLVYTLRAFQPMEEDFPPEQFHFLGPSVYPRQEEQFPLLPSPIIYISLGTIVKGGKSFFRTCLEAFRNETVSLVLSVGNTLDPASLGPVPENWIIRSHVPQLAILQQADIFITHGGMNSISEAMTAGVPMVVIPFVSDQPTNARQVERLGLGKLLPPKSVTPETLRRTAFSVLSDPSIQKQTQIMKQQIAAAPGNSGAAAILEELVSKTNGGNNYGTCM